MEITFQYFEDCPSHEEGLARLKEVLAEEGIGDEIEVVRVDTEAQAQALHFVGSPTILLEGEDIVPHAEGAYYNLTCRVYWLENGRPSPLPSKAMIRHAIQAVRERQE